MAEALTKTSQEFSLIFLSDILYFNPGDDVVLSCHLKPAVSAASMEIQWWYRTDLVCHYKDGRVTVNRGYEGQVSLSLEDLLDGNVTLTLRDVRRSQKGLYICEVTNESQSIQDHVFLHISSEDFEMRLVTPIGTVSADPGSDVILPVHLSPETSAVNIRWFKGTELIYQYKNRQEMTNYENRVSVSIQELERGNLALTLRNFQNSDSGDYTCKVFHDGCLQTEIVNLQVREIQLCSDPGHRHLCDVLRQVQNDILLGKAQLLQGTIHLIQETLNEGPTHRRSNSMERIPSLLEDDGMQQALTTEAGRLARHNYGQSRRRTSEVNTVTHQDLVQLITQNLLRNIAGELTNVPTRALTHGQESPGASTRISERPEDRRLRTRQRRQSIQNMCQIM